MTTQTESAIVDPALNYPSPLQEFWQGFAYNRGAVIGLGFLLLVLLAAVFAPWVAPHDPVLQYRAAMLTPPCWSLGGQSQFLLGTDEIGRDMLSRLIFGSRLSLSIGLSAVLTWRRFIPGCWGR